MVKLKTIWTAIFQPSNTFMIQKSMRHVDSNSSTSGSDDSDEYRLKREKNNESVRKSRMKNRIKLQDCASKVQQLSNENYQLNKKLHNCVVFTS